jgi:hypothetical protein
MTFGRQQSDPGAVALDQGIGCNRGAVDDAFGLGQQRRAPAAELSRQPLEPVENADRGVAGSRGNLLQGRPAEIVDCDEIGEGAADIDADAVYR